MLDQNTDRMWYVIGAVLVGAAIILIANGTLPQIFASVTDNFQNVSDVANVNVESISGDSTQRLTAYLNNPRNWTQASLTATFESTGGVHVESTEHIRTDFIDIDSGTYRLSVDVETEEVPRIVVFVYDDSNKYMTMNVLSWGGKFHVDEGERIRLRYTHVYADDTTRRVDEDRLPSDVGSKYNFTLERLGD